MNGDFESEPLDGGLDWRVMPMQGVEAATDSSIFYSGTRSLEIRFFDAGNIFYRHVLQFVPVRPNARYRFTAYLRAAGITTDSGLFLQIQDPE